MNKPEDKIEKLFQDHIDDFDRMPDNSLWEHIEAELPPLARTRRFLYWGMAAALLLFSLVGYLMYQKQDTGYLGEVKHTESGAGKNAKVASEVTQKKPAAGNGSSEPAGKQYKSQVSDKNEAVKLAEVKIAGGVLNKAKGTQKNKAMSGHNVTSENQDGIAKSNDKAERSSLQRIEKSLKQADLAANPENRHTKQNAEISAAEPGYVSAESEDDLKLPDVAYLAITDTHLAYEVPVHKPVAYTAEEEALEQKERFFRIPSELYVSLTPSLNYYRVFSNMAISQFNGAGNGGRLGWAVQAGMVYPLKLKRLSYRVGVSYFSAQSNFRYLLNKGKEPVRLNNNTFEYGTVGSLQMESKKWQVAELQNDLLFDVRPNQQVVAGFKAGTNFSEQPVFDTYLGYRLSKPVGARQVLWLEGAYAYALNSQRSSVSTFSYHMDKYSLRIGLNFK